ncbi:MAG TPA: serine/threonine-protein kinase [Candidatus Binatia bacterium]|nr:serine/threonine-protein kinase [Candidatus Binatia bacterium]
MSRRGPKTKAMPGLGTPDPRSASRGRWTSLPPDVLRGVRKRVAVFALAIAGIWALVLFVHDVVAPLIGHHHTAAMGWPYPGNVIGAIGLLTALAVWLYARRNQCDCHRMINLALVFQVVTSALIAIQANWTPVLGDPRVSWLCLLILITPAIVPTPPLKTLVVSLLIATMDPVALALAAMRDVPMSHDPYMMLWYLLPNYICVGLALIPSTLISGLGRRVNEARELGAYQLDELLGKGGMGEVYRARHRMLARPAAIKLIRPETLGDAEGSRVMIQRFHREAQAAALLRSPHTINLYDFGVTDEGVFYYVMELLDGFDLDTLVRRFGPLPPERAIVLMQHVCRSLGEAHSRGLIHRDVKPSNIFTCRLGLNVDFGKVLDFGLVKVSEPLHGSGETAALLTQADLATGTPAFMAPEVATGDGPVDRRVDIYALGCVGYWLLTGKLVFEAETPIKTMLRHVQAQPAPPSEVSELEIPEELDRLILQCLAKHPDQRPGDAITLGCALESVPVRERWTTARAEKWWEIHSPAPAPMTELRPPTPVETLHAAK